MKLFDIVVGFLGVLAVVGYVLFRCLTAWYFILGGGAPVKSQRRW